VTRIGWLDPASGASGDMLLGTLVDLGVDIALLQAAVDAVAPEPITLRAEKVERGGLAATRLHVDGTDSVHHRHWSDVRQLITAGTLDAAVESRALATFEALAVAEGAVHGTSPDEVHFHEVGALDAIADVVATCAGLVSLELDEVAVGPIALGSGTIRAAHGILAVPGPAVVELLAHSDAQSYGGGEPDGVHVELCTPTGAALLVTWGTRFGPMPTMRLQAQGFGAGGRDFAGKANVLRMVIGEAVAGDGSVSTQLVVESNVDDLDPRVWPHVLTALLAAGAADAWLTPIVMKKGRPAHTLAALTDSDHYDAVCAAVFAQTSAIGLRSYPVGKLALARRVETVTLPGGATVRVKLAVDPAGSVVNVQPEHDDVEAAALAARLPMKVVLAQAQAAASSLWG